MNHLTNIATYTSDITIKKHRSSLQLIKKSSSLFDYIILYYSTEVYVLLVVQQLRKIIATTNGLTLLPMDLLTDITTFYRLLQSRYCNA